MSANSGNGMDIWLEWKKEEYHKGLLDINWWIDEEIDRVWNGLKEWKQQRRHEIGKKIRPKIADYGKWVSVAVEAAGTTDTYKDLGFKLERKGWFEEEHLNHGYNQIILFNKEWHHW